MTEQYNHYKTLGIEKNASLAEIKTAYRQRARENHPDQHQGSAEANTRMQDINEAYRILSNAMLRSTYDRESLKPTDDNQTARWEPSGNAVNDFTSVFNAFGGKNSRRTSGR